MPLINRGYVVVVKIDSAQVIDDIGIANEIFQAVDDVIDVVSVNPFGGDAPTVQDPNQPQQPF